MTLTPQEAEWWYTDHLRGVIMVVMSLLALQPMAVTCTPAVLKDCMQACLAIIGLVPAVQLLFFAEVGTACKGLALVFAMVSGWLLASGVWKVREAM